MQSDLQMDDHSYANVVNLFLVAYTISYLISGRLVDRLGTRSSTAFFVLWWSLANTATAFADGVRSLGACRFMLGLGEAGIWPAASKLVSEWFPAKERALAVGLYTMGATLGAMLVPQLIIPLAAYDFAGGLPAIHRIVGSMEGWRIAFLLCGIIGLLWILPWLALSRNPAQNKLLTEKEATLIATGSPPSPAGSQPWPWKRILLFRPLWLFLAARLLTDPVWYFYQFWFAKFLHSTHHIPQNDLTITWVLYAAAGAGSLIGGWVSGRLIARGMAPEKARMRVMLACACVMPLSPLIATVSGIPHILLLASTTVFCAVAWLTNLSTLVVDTVPKHSLGSIFSTIAAGSTIGSVAMNLVLVEMISTPSSQSQEHRPHGSGILENFFELIGGHGYLPWFVIMAFLHPAAWLVLRWGRSPDHRSSPLQSS